MLFALWLFAFAAALELAMWLMPAVIRRIVASITVAPLTASAAALFILYPSLATGIVALASAYRFCNMLRVVLARINEKYLRRAGMQTSFWLISTQAAVLFAWSFGRRVGIHSESVWLAVACLALVASIVMLAATARNIWKTRAPRIDVHTLATNELPSLTVAIPARNETDELETCLTSLVASNYPKLEILVLDDCSQDKRTPEIIRQFAHDGVRFIQGKVPGDNWLAKNQAYQQLFEESNGEYIVFCGVDTRFGPDSLRLLVAAALKKRKTMISIIPKNVIPAAFSGRSSTLLQPMRYAWELALPRRLFHRPAVLSTCWIAKRELLASAGGFGAVSRSVVPESYFARVSAVHDGYSFMQGNDKMNITSNKTSDEQLATAVRTRYPQVHRRIEMVFALTLAELFGIIMPFGLLVAAKPANLSSYLAILGGATVIILTCAYALVVTLAYRLWLVRSLVLLPFACIADIALLNYSMIRYEFFTVEWKGRNVCIPVMRVVAQLPPMAPKR